MRSGSDAGVDALAKPSISNCIRKYGEGGALNRLDGTYRNPKALRSGCSSARSRTSEVSRSPHSSDGVRRVNSPDRHWASHLDARFRPDIGDIRWPPRLYRIRPIASPSLKLYRKLA